MNDLVNLLAGLSYKTGKDMLLSSGNYSDVIIDASLTLRHSQGMVALKKVLSKVHLDFSCVAGPSSGADPICAAVQEVFSAKQHVKWLSVRKESKTHGFDTGMITGPFTKGERTLVVDDVLTTGKSIIHAIRECKKQELNVVGALVVIDREEFDGKEKVLQHVPWVQSLCTKKDIERVDPRFVEYIGKFYETWRIK